LASPGLYRDLSGFSSQTLGRLARPIFLARLRAPSLDGGERDAPSFAPVAFPYPLPELDLAAPFDRHRASVRPEWVDANGHMNVGYYVVAFDHATDTFCEPLGIAWSYVEHKLGMVFILETHATFVRELKAGDPLRVTTQLLAHDDKRLHFFHMMHHGSEGWRAATNELMMMHIDYGTRRASPWPDETMRRLDRLAQSHGRLARPAEAGRIIALKRAAPLSRPPLENP
jgi:acyl-CoA thioester hydrolase